MLRMPPGRAAKDEAGEGGGEPESYLSVLETFSKGCLLACFFLPFFLRPLSEVLKL